MTIIPIANRMQLKQAMTVRMVKTSLLYGLTIEMLVAQGYTIKTVPMVEIHGVLIKESVH